MIKFLYLCELNEGQWKEQLDQFWERNPCQDDIVKFSEDLLDSVFDHREEIDQLVEKIEQKKVPFKIIGFGSDLDTSWTFGEKEIQDGSTDIGQVMDHIRTQENNGLAGSIIITDGQVNLGQEIPSQDLNITSPIHIIGVGDETPLVDVAIHAIDAPPVIHHPHLRCIDSPRAD